MNHPSCVTTACKLAWEKLNENLAHYPRSSTEGQSSPA